MIRVLGTRSAAVERYLARRGEAVLYDHGPALLADLREGDAIAVFDDLGEDAEHLEAIALERGFSVSYPDRRQIQQPTARDERAAWWRAEVARLASATLPVGWTRGPGGQLERDAAEQAVREEILALHEAGTSGRQIVEILRQRGRKGRTGKPVVLATVQRILAAA